MSNSRSGGTSASRGGPTSPTASPGSAPSLKWAGTELPGIRVGSFHEDRRVTFAVCHGHKPGTVINLANSKYDKVVLTVDNAEEIAARMPVPPS